jgi:hypothetical protein
MLNALSIFEKKKKDDKYTEKALLYQYILKYAISDGFIKKAYDKLKLGNNDPDSVNIYSFSYWEIAEWLKDNFPLYKEHYLSTQGRKNLAIENIQKNVKLKLKDLTTLGLIKLSGTRKQKKGTGLVPLYRQTKFGNLIAWIIESFDPTKSKSAVAEIYSILASSIYKIHKSSPSYTIFYSKFFNKCMKMGVFDYVVNQMRLMISANLPLINIEKIDSDSDNVNVYFNPTYIENNLHLLEIWIETIKELDPSIRRLVLYHKKLEIEETMETKASNTKGYEKMRYKISDDFDKVALEAYCENCGGHYTSVALDLIDYIGHIADLLCDPLSLHVKCPICNGEKKSKITFALLP